MGGGPFDLVNRLAAGECPHVLATWRPVEQGRGVPFKYAPRAVRCITDHRRERPGQPAVHRTTGGKTWR